MSNLEYVTEIIRTIHETEEASQEEDRMPTGLLHCWIECIKDSCNRYYEEYLKGHRESFFMTEEEYDQIFEKAGMDYTSALLNNLIDRNMVEVAVDDSGEMVYRATETALKHIK